MQEDQAVIPPRSLRASDPVGPAAIRCRMCRVVRGKEFLRKGAGACVSVTNGAIGAGLARCMATRISDDQD